MHLLISLLFGIILFVFIISIIVIFAFPRFSPIPYFPTNHADIPLILKTLKLRNNQTVIDLGAGDGIVIFKAAEETAKQRLNTQFIAVEINPILILVLSLRRLLHPNRNNIRIVKKDMFTLNYSKLISTDLSRSQPNLTVYLYASPWLIEKTIRNITKQIKLFDLVSYFYQVKCLPKHKDEMKEGVHKIFRYSEAGNSSNSI